MRKFTERIIIRGRHDPFTRSNSMLETRITGNAINPDKYTYNRRRN
jgi:hypothetical protein